ncbi:hypothetical protein BLNAU_19950 [Blattamonas nauphoetae]|uniref:Uncharacterized protein n=1 Tax=Blattamonas nauphoetae TaxID=2049346 RepID=A0ABQ9X368_9EUKA|nr:hypothetical protein BLNAU_19950 [Blattamonas nauphoetae]
MDSNNPIPAIGEILGSHVKNSVCLATYGQLWLKTRSSGSGRSCHSVMNEGDCVRMEVDLDSTPRTLQFFVNGEAGECYIGSIRSDVVSVMHQDFPINDTPVTLKGSSTDVVALTVLLFDPTIRSTVSGPRHNVYALPPNHPTLMPSKNRP